MFSIINYFKKGKNMKKLFIALVTVFAFTLEVMAVDIQKILPAFSQEVYPQIQGDLKQVIDAVNGLSEEQLGELAKLVKAENTGKEVKELLKDASALLQEKKLNLLKAGTAAAKAYDLGGIQGYIENRDKIAKKLQELNPQVANTLYTKAKDILSKVLQNKTIKDALNDLGSDKVRVIEEFAGVSHAY